MACMTALAQPPEPNCGRYVGIGRPARIDLDGSLLGRCGRGRIPAAPRRPIVGHRRPAPSTGQAAFQTAAQRSRPTAYIARKNEKYRCRGKARLDHFWCGLEQDGSEGSQDYCKLEGLDGATGNRRESSAESPDYRSKELDRMDQCFGRMQRPKVSTF